MSIIWSRISFKERHNLCEALEVEAEFLLDLRKRLMPDLYEKTHDSEREETKGNQKASKGKPGRKKVKLTETAEGERTIVLGHCAIVDGWRACGEKCPFFYVTESRGATVVELRCVSASDPTFLDVEGFVPITEK